MLRTEKYESGTSCVCQPDVIQRSGNVKCLFTQILNSRNKKIKHLYMAMSSKDLHLIQCINFVMCYNQSFCYL